MDPLQQLMAAQPYQQGDFQRSGPQMQPTGVLESLMGAFAQKPWGVGDTVNAMAMAVPGARMRGATPVFAAEKGAGGGAGTATNAARLTEAAGNRQLFDGMLEEYRNLPSSELKSVATEFLGYAPNAKSKSDMIDALKRRQRQDELNADRTKAQSKVVP